jgi:broad-specificity NMP kinase
MKLTNSISISGTTGTGKTYGVCKLVNDLGLKAVVLEDLLNYITKDVHTTFSTKTQCNEDVTMKMLCHVPGLGVKTISKMLQKRNFTVFEFINMDIEELQKLAGKASGIKIYNAIHCI